MAEAKLSGVSRETIADLKIYERELRRWQKIKNLVAPSTLEHLWTRHFSDSAQLLALKPDARRWADLGSGAGFPGLITATLLKNVPGASVHLIESDHRKCAFLRETARALGAPAIIHNARAEEVVFDLQDVEIVTARALAPLRDLLELAMPLLEKGAEGLFLKGQDVASELTDDAIFSRVTLEFFPSITSEAARIVGAKLIC